MKNRRNIFKTLEENVPKEFVIRVKELFEEVRNAFQNFSIFEEDLLYIKLFSLLYDASNHRYTNMELSYELHLDVKSIKKLINKIETFVMNFIAFYSYYHPLKQYMQK